MMTKAEILQIRAKHYPAKQRTHDQQGRKVNDPLQCANDLKAWPCETSQLCDELLVRMS